MCACGQFNMRSFAFVTLVWTLTNTFGLHVSYDDDWTCFDSVNMTKEASSETQGSAFWATEYQP